MSANSSTLVLHKGYDWGLSYKQKLLCAVICTACSLIPWIGYSTPNTMYVAHLIGRTLNLQLLGVTISGSIVLQSVAICINLAEYAFIHLCIWKGDAIHWVGLVITMVASCSGSFIFHDQAQDAVRFKKGEISSYQNMGKTFQDLSAAQNELIEARKEQIRSLNTQESEYRRSVYNGTIAKIPDFIAFRKRQAAEDIESALRLKAAYADSLSKYTKTSIKIESDAGYLVDFGTGAKKISLGVTIFIEVFLVFFGFMAVLLWDSAAQDKSKGGKIKNKKEIVFTDDEEDENENSSKNVVILKKNKSDQGRPIGFAVQQDNHTTNVKVKVNSAEAICMIIDHYNEIGEPVANSKIAEMVGCSDTWVATVRKKYRSN